jgi:hypothetical protein
MGLFELFHQLQQPKVVIIDSQTFQLGRYLFVLLV